MVNVKQHEHGSQEKKKFSIQDTFIWRFKQHLQFTGWLQYYINFIFSLPFLLASAILWLFKFSSMVVIVPLAVAAIVLGNLLFDLATVRWGIHPAEHIPPPRLQLDVFDLMRSRRSCRAFQKRNLTKEHLDAVLNSVKKHTKDDVLIGTNKIRFEYIAAPLTVWPSVGGHEFLVAIAPHEYNRLSVIDVGRSLQKVVLDATRLGIATCWIGPGADHRSILAHLGDRLDGKKDHIICVCALGYPSRYKPIFVRFMQFQQHRRLPLNKLFFADPTFQEPLPVQSPPFSNFGRCYEVCEWSPSSFNAQPTRCAAVVENSNGKVVPLRFDFCASTSSRYYAAVALGIWCANWETGCNALGLKGHFKVLTQEERNLKDIPDFPRYDVSWMVDPVN